MHGHAFWFVNGEQVIIFQKHRKFARRRVRRAALLLCGLWGGVVGQANRWNAHHIAHGKPRVNLSPTFVDAHLA